MKTLTVFVLLILCFSQPSFAGAGEVTLAWDPPLDATGLAGYMIHFGPEPGQYDNSYDVGNVTQCTVSGLAPGTYYFAVTAYNEEGEESGYSNEVVVSIDPSREDPTQEDTPQE